MLPKGNLENKIQQLSQENVELKQTLADLKFEYEKQVLLCKVAQDQKNEYDRLFQQNQLLNQEQKQLQDEIQHLKNQIKKLEYVITQLNRVNAQQLQNHYQLMEANSINIQQRNQELERELETFKQKALFIIQAKTIIDNNKQYCQLTLEWEKDIQNLQLSYRQENDSLIFDGYGESGNKKVIYQQIHNFAKKGLIQNQKPLISLKQSQMKMTFEV
ncbi:unnamed protein product (macronuclear) [Paramecium tetraurelia]|uniref:Uncharacterized protein n=1 Tax=Paramecium tetraurelia TaxID=5888 RepID=A0D088_PARTE|nr:uncharacterized protein GSPATT00012007001 [Paramecium tetraurelia]CAK76455.1 unnamed protein product [Paramecium tetraurelia]|eukprot:XP_001443852.1 hypothetical protein (macronuclear) [Paramecium tetraurelia strain d4-2]